MTEGGNDLEDIRARERELEKRVSSIETSFVLLENNFKHSQGDIEEIRDNLKGIRAGISKLIWAAGLIFLTGALNFFLKGSPLGVF